MGFIEIRQKAMGTRQCPFFLLPTAHCLLSGFTGRKSGFTEYCRLPVGQALY